ncbi:MAG: heme-binding Shp domain-containing protein [Lachnospiraceae bacterium]|nr:heme-binding Shp domain-containing protein [Lachnospiraceae bacterium]
MKTAKKNNRILAGFLAFALALILGAGALAVPVYAANGNVYTCTVTPTYRNPITGEIEDSGGESSYATGQGMVEGAVYTTGIMEVLASGEYYLTIRMSLMDYTSNQSFWVQNVGDSAWSSPAMGVTGNGSDTNGTTADVCIQVPSENCVVRCSMYVEPMGRDVVFFIYPSNYSEGNSTDMQSTMITADAGSTDTQSGNDTQTTNSGSSTLTNGNAALSGSGTKNQESTEENETQPTAMPTETPAESPAETETLQSSIVQAATEDSTQDAQDTTLNDAQGLSLSTAGEDVKTETSGADTGSAAKQILILVSSITIAGLILIGTGAVLVYYFRKNWYRWGGGEDDE